MFRHHQHQENQIPEGESPPKKGMVCHLEPSSTDRNLSVVQVEVGFKSGQTVRLTFHLDNLYQPEAGSPEARMLIDLRTAQKVNHPDRIPKVQIPFWEGSWLPLTVDPEDPKQIVVDEAALRKTAVKQYIEQAKRAHTAVAAGPHASGPPWEVPTHCPTCGAPVDQAVASKETDPKCPFCQEPIPVTPAGPSRSS